MVAFPGHAFGVLDYSIYRIEQGPIPVVFQNAPAAFNWVIFAVIGRIIRQADRDVIVLYKLQEPLHELRTPTLILRTIVQIDEERLERRKALFDRFPPVLQEIDETITGHC